MRYLAPYLILFTLIGAIFLIWPSIDLWFSGLFYEPESRFYLNKNSLVQAVYIGTKWLTGLAAVILLGMMARTFIKPQHKTQRGPLLFLILALALGPGLMVNTVFKDQWDRARPVHITEFGGDKQFTPPIVMSDQCDKNCSFVSGHPASGYVLLALGYLGAFANRRKWLIRGVIIGGFIGFGRIVQGGHFLSDVLFSFLVVLVTTHVLYLLLSHFGLLPKQTRE